MKIELRIFKILHFEKEICQVELHQLIFKLKAIIYH